MPKFIWMSEYSLPNEYDNNKIGWRILLDATAMNYQQNIFISIRNRNNLILKENSDDDNSPLVQY